MARVFVTVGRQRENGRDYPIALNASGSWLAAWWYGLTVWLCDLVTFTRPRVRGWHVQEDVATEVALSPGRDPVADRGINGVAAPPLPEDPGGMVSAAGVATGVAAPSEVS